MSQKSNQQSSNFIKSSTLPMRRFAEEGIIMVPIAALLICRYMMGVEGEVVMAEGQEKQWESTNGGGDDRKGAFQGKIDHECVGCWCRGR